MVKIRLPEDRDTTEMLEKLDQLYARYRGDTPVLMYLPHGKVIKTKPGAGVRPTAEFVEEARKITGNTNVKIMEVEK